jgi:toxin ParE1/3/4
METGKKKVKKSEFYFSDIQDIYEYGQITFGNRAADIFYEDLLFNVENLEVYYFLHPECRHLETKSKKYRNIILGSYLIIYRITPTRIEVLRAFHGSRSPRVIRNSRSLKIS